MSEDGVDMKGTGRRNFMKSFAGAAFLPVASLNSERKKRITTAVRNTKTGKEAALTEKVSKRWYGLKNHVEDVNKEVQAKFLNMPGVECIGITAREETVGNKRKLQIKVEIDESDITPESSFDPAQDIPSKIKGVPVKQIEASVSEPVACHNGGSTNNLEGGWAIDNNSDMSSYGSTGWRVEHNGGKKMLTASHVTTSDTICTDTSGTDMYVGGDKVGSVDVNDQNLDIATITESNVDHEDTIQGESTTYTIDGYLNKDGISSRVSDWYDGYRIMGATSGEETGGLGDYEQGSSETSVDCMDWGGEGVQGNASVRGGDSGGPAFSVSNGNAYLAFSISEGKEPDQYESPCGRTVRKYWKSQGVAAYHLENQGFNHIVPDN